MHHHQHREEDGAEGGTRHLPEIRPLVIGVSPSPDETLIGLLARATAANVLGSTDVILGEVGFVSTRSGLVGQRLGDLTARLASKLGCDEAEIARRVHPIIDGATARANPYTLVRWGVFALERQYLLLGRRRISPLTLHTSHHHRWPWMCTLLPYCPESLELLVDACGLCGAPLGWTQARGIGRCETCRQIVPPNDGHPLQEENVADYRRFARLLSPVPGDREAVIDGLASDLRALSDTSLITLIVRTGKLFAAETDQRRRLSPGGIDPKLLSKFVADGMRMASDWPNALRVQVADKVETADGEERAELLLRIRRLADRQVAPDLAAAIRSALPEAFEITQRALAFKEPTVLSRDICNMAGIEVREVRRLEKAKVFTVIETRGGERRHAQYLRGEVEDFVRHKRESQRATRLAEGMGIPRYGVEQLITLGEVEREMHPGVLVLDPHLRLTDDSVQDLYRDVNRRASEAGAPPLDVVPLWTASRAVGGGLKNWGELLGRVRRGTLDVWSIPDDRQSRARHSKLVRRLLIRPNDAIAALRMPVIGGADPDISAEVTSQADACEILNIDANQMKRVVAAGDLVFEEKGKGSWTPLKRVLELARDYISVPELAYLTNRYAPELTRTLYARPDIPHGSVGWLRTDVERELPTLAGGASSAWRSWQGSAVRVNVAARGGRRDGRREAKSI